MPEEKQVLGLVRFGRFELSADTGELRKDGVRLKLSGQAIQVLAMLAANPGRLVTREELQQKLWPGASYGDPEHGLNAAVNKLRETLGDSATDPKYIETIPGRGYRFIAPLKPPHGIPQLVPPQPELGARDADEAESNSARRTIRWVVAGATALAMMIVGGGWWVLSRKSHALTEKDTIVLADFTNTTGDPVFDGTLRQGLAVQLEQSPFLTLVPDQRVQQTLRLMGQPPDARLTPEIARDLCQRTQSAAFLNGSIASLGSQYVLSLKAVGCRTGNSLAEEQVTADGKERVLKALGDAATKLRAQLGETLSTVEKFDTPLEQATTPSLEALQAYSLGRKAVLATDFAGAVPFLQRAIRLDPNFATAYAELGTSYADLGELSLSKENTRKAYELREGVSEREKLYIETNYYDYVTGEWEKSRQGYELWAQVYPRDRLPHGNLAVTYGYLGQYDKALAESREAVRLDPQPIAYANLVAGYISLNRLEEAQATAREAQAKQLDSPLLQFDFYSLAFLNRDETAMEKQVAWAAGKPGIEAAMLAAEADTNAFFGRLKTAREFSRRAVDSAERAEEKEAAAGYEAAAAIREALFGNAVEARQRAAAALGLSNGQVVQNIAAVALAMVGDSARAQALGDDLAKRFPLDTGERFINLPTLYAQLALTRNDSAKALEALRAAAPFPLALGAVYVRGKAYIAANQGNEAAAEFQKFLDHRGLVGNDPIGALAHLQIGRAYAMEGDTAKAKAAYQDFLTLWKDADPDIPIYKAAKAEYAKLQ